MATLDPSDVHPGAPGTSERGPSGTPIDIGESAGARHRLAKMAHEFNQLVSAAGLCMLTTRNATTGQLHARPMVIREHAEMDVGTFYFVTDMGTGKVDELMGDTHVNLSFVNPVLAKTTTGDETGGEKGKGKEKRSGDFSNLTGGEWFSVAGRAFMVTEEEKRRALWGPDLATWFPNLGDNIQYLPQIHEEIETDINHACTGSTGEWNDPRILVLGVWANSITYNRIGAWGAPLTFAPSGVTDQHIGH